MDKKKKAKLESQGWTVGSADEFLGLNRNETEYLDLKMSLAEGLSKTRRSRNVSQTALAK